LFPFLVFWFIFSGYFRPFLNLLSERERRFKDLNDRTEQLIKEARAAEEERERRLAATRHDAIDRRETERRKAEAEAAQLMEAAKAEGAANARAGARQNRRRAQAREANSSRWDTVSRPNWPSAVLGRPLHRSSGQN